MDKGNGLRGYLYEHVFYETVNHVRETTGQTVPISQAKAIRASIDARLGGAGLKDPSLGVSRALQVIDESFEGAGVEGWTRRFAEWGQSDPAWKADYAAFAKMTEVGSAAPSASARLPISPYDPDWSSRRTVRTAGTSELYALNSDIEKSAGGKAGNLTGPACNGVTLWAVDEDGATQKQGRAMTLDDFAGLTALMDKMSEREYRDIRDWVIDGGKDPATGRIDYHRYMSPSAVERSAAMLDELKSRGIAYQVMRDRNPGQAKARLRDTGMEIRITDAENEAYAGARIYDNGTIVRYSTNRLNNGLYDVPDLAPEQARDLLAFALGDEVERKDIPGISVGDPGHTHPEYDHRSKKLVNVPDAYSVGGRKTMAAIDDYVVPGADAANPGEKLFLLRDEANHSLPRMVYRDDQAVEYLENAVSSARENLAAALGVERLIQAVNDELVRTEGDLDEIEPPAFHSDPEVAAIQRSYWDVLTGARQDLLRPGATSQMYEERLEQIGEDPEWNPVDGVTYVGTPEQKVLSHRDDVLLDLVGTFYAEDGRTAEDRLADPEAALDIGFDPVRTARWMDSDTGQWMNQDEIAAASRHLKLVPEQMLGTGFQADRFRDRLVAFDPASSVPMNQHNSAFIREMGWAVRGSIARAGAEPGAIAIDKNGVVRWTGGRMKRDGSMEEVRGEIGQIFDVGEHGEIRTAFASGENSLIVPGYEARIRANEPGAAPRSVEERTLLRGYQQIMTERIQYQVANDLGTGRTVVGEPSSLNRVYSRLYGTKHPLDYVEQHTVGGTWPENDPVADRIRALQREYLDAAHTKSVAADYYGEEGAAENLLLDEQLRQMGRNHPFFDDGPVIRAWVEDPETAAEKVFDLLPAELSDPGSADAFTLEDIHDMVMTVAYRAGIYIEPAQEGEPVGFYVQGTDMPVPFARERLDPWTESILATEARRVRYDNSLRDGSTIFAQYMAEQRRTDPADDNTFDAWRLTGGRNIAILTGTDANGVAAPAGYFDPVMTSGGANQGLVRYLTSDARVDADGAIRPGDPESLTGSRAPLMTRPELETLRHDPFDRQQMTSSNLMQSSSVTEPEGTALMTFGGWGADDGIVVSSDFAARHRIVGAQGEQRDLVVGDKISDLHGNKGVITLIVDRDMDPEAAREQDVEQEVAWFKGNPQMDVVMSPFSLISRRNAGAAHELMDNEAKDLATPDSESIHSGLSRMRFIVTHMAVDEKTKIYDEEAILSGRGRKASSQLAWALQSQDCPAVMREFYGHNSGAEANLREYMLVCGIDMDADGTLRVVGRDEGGENRPERRFLPMPELVYTARGSVNGRAMKAEFARLIGDAGGDMEIPFPLTYPTGEQTESVSPTSYSLPVMSSHLRSGQDFEDGSSVAHDYTKAYQDVFVQACTYRGLAERLEGDGVTPRDKEAILAQMSECAGIAQRRFESITEDLKSRRFTGKYNVFKTGLMTSRLSDSATMVWTADPRLDIDQVALSSAKAEQLGLAEGDHALVWRDPILRDAGVRYMRVAIDDRLTGAAINPVADKSFDGDFDGDSVAIVRLHTEAAKEEALAKLSMGANLVDKGAVEFDGSHPLSTQVSLDTQVGLSKDGALAEEFAGLTRVANSDFSGPDTDDLGLVEGFSNLYRQAQRGEFGSALSFAGRDEHIDSIRRVCLDTGAKGNEKKLDEYARNLDEEVPQAAQEESMYATSAKAIMTGVCGGYPQRAMRALRGVDPEVATELTYPVTQSSLQAKHDAAEAKHKYQMVMGPARDLWRGRKMEHSGPGQWTPVYQNGEPVQADKDEWATQFVEMYEAKDGLNVNIDPKMAIRAANALVDPATGVMRNLEEDPSIEVAPLDRLAYGGTFDDLVDLADKRAGLFDGERDAQFACSGTVHAIRQTERNMAGPLSRAEDLGLVLDTRVVKKDTVAESDPLSRRRGEERRSPIAVTANRRPLAPEVIAAPAGNGTQFGD